jgi:hypothetical protein
MDSSPSPSYRKLYFFAAAILIVIGVCLRVWQGCSTTLWADEAESSINGLSILETGFPASHYLGQPIYENTLVEPFPESEEYEFRDSSYSKKGLAVYHSWLPLYAIAGAQWLCGLKPDKVDLENAVPLHGKEEIFLRTLAPRLPALVFSFLLLVVVYVLVGNIAGGAAALTSLTWLALGSKAIEFGHQARYYSLTLLMSAFCAFAAWRLYKRGKTVDYVILGIAEGLLFHTHQLSAVIFACACLMLIPRVIKQNLWHLKAVLVVGISGTMILPWAIFSGFFEAAVEIPKAYELFNSPKEWIAYFLDRPVIFLSVGLIVCLLPLSRWAVRKGWKSPTALSEDNLAAMVFLIGWIVIAVLAFHILIPAASFFLTRLTLILYTPVAILMGIAVSEYFPQRFAFRFAASLCLPLAILYLSHHIPKKPRSFDIDERFYWEFSGHILSLPQ